MLRPVMKVLAKACTLFLLCLAGCGDQKPENPPPKMLTADDHDRIYKEGCDLIQPYMQLHGVESRPANNDKARDELKRGISLLEIVVKVNPENWSAYWIIGKGHQALGASEDACDAFGKAFAIQNENADVAREYMLECLMLGRASEGIRAAEHAVQLDPDNAGLIANLALAYLIGGRLDDAEEAVDKSLSLAPDDQITKDLRKGIVEVKAGKRPQPKSIRDIE
jgi:tetratricopeptide (TPR) repeat protein